MPQEKFEPSLNVSQEKAFDPAKNVTCVISAGKADVTINDNQSDIRKFGSDAGEIKELSISSVTKITVKGASNGQNKVRIDF